MNFAEAFKAMQEGGKVTRPKEDDPNLYLVLVPSQKIIYAGFGGKKYAPEWIPNAEDLAAEDWELAGSREEEVNEKILPRPVIRDFNGKLAKDYSVRDWYLKLQEEIFEAHEETILGFKDYDSLALELADIITVCISWLEWLGYDEEKRSELFARINVQNKDRN